MTPDMLENPRFFEGRNLCGSPKLLRSNRYEWSKLVPWQNMSKVVWLFLGGSEIRLLCGILLLGWAKNTYSMCVYQYIHTSCGEKGIKQNQQ